MKEILILIPLIAIAGCRSTGQYTTFIDQNKVGVSLTGSMAEQRADITVGYANSSLAVVPTTKPDGGDIRAKRASDVDKALANTASTATNQTMAEDSLSVFASFNTEAKIQETQSPSVAFGRIFATGVAASEVAAGFKSKIGNESTLCHTPR